MQAVGKEGNTVLSVTLRNSTKPYGQVLAYIPNLLRSVVKLIGVIYRIGEFKYIASLAFRVTCKCSSKVTRCQAYQTHRYVYFGRLAVGYIPTHSRVVITLAIVSCIAYLVTPPAGSIVILTEQRDRQAHIFILFFIYSDTHM